MDIIRGNVEWNKLKTLTIQSFDVSARSINQILCGSPLLEEFTLVLVGRETNANLCFRSASLKRLQICKTSAHYNDGTSSQLEIWTPNLERLTISGLTYSKCLLTNVSSLTEANVFLDWANVFLDASRRVISATPLDCAERSLSQILPAIPHVKRLTLSHLCFKALENMKSKCLLSPLPNVKILTFAGSFEEHEQILDLLEIFPKLKTLVVLQQESTLVDAMSKSEFKFEPNPSKPFLEELTTVYCTCTSHDCSIIPFIKSMLKHASKLEKMMLRVKAKGTRPPSLPVEELLSMPRSSPAAELMISD